MISKQPGFRYGIAGALMLIAAGCTAIPQPAAPPPAPRPVAPAPTPAPLPTPTAGWEDRAVDAGAWRYDAGSRTAAFVPTGSANPLLSMTCSGGGIRMTSALAGNVSLRTSAGTDQIRFDGGSANLANRDPRLDRGRVAADKHQGVVDPELDHGHIRTMPNHIPPEPLPGQFRGVARNARIDQLERVLAKVEFVSQQQNPVRRRTTPGRRRISEGHDDVGIATPCDSQQQRCGGRRRLGGRAHALTLEGPA